MQVLEGKLIHQTPLYQIPIHQGPQAQPRSYQRAVLYPQAQETVLPQQLESQVLILNNSFSKKEKHQLNNDSQ
jgi:hypothetical protein